MFWILWIAIAAIAVMLYATMDKVVEMDLRLERCEGKIEVRNSYFHDVVRKPVRYEGLRVVE